MSEVRNEDRVEAERWLSLTCHCHHPHGECVSCGCPLLAVPPMVLQEADPVCPACRAPWAGMERVTTKLHLARHVIASLLASQREAREALTAFVEHWNGYEDQPDEFWEAEDKKGVAIIRKARAALSRLGARGRE